MSHYKTGKQPCDNFKARDELFEGSGNAHECMKHAPFSCVGNVSFCENCYKDHHENGYETCKKEGGDNEA